MKILLTRWQRVTLPLPYYAMTPHTRFRFLHTDGTDTEWALDDGEWLCLSFIIIIYPLIMRVVGAPQMIS